MNLWKRTLGVVAVCVLLFACREEAPPQREPAPGPVETSTTAARDVKPSPEVLALLEPDPDLETTITPEEAKATLEAARQRGPVPQTTRPQPARAAGEPRAADSDTAGSGEWAKLEGEKRRKIEAWQKRLESTTVYVADDSPWYHSAGCEDLHRYFFDRNRVLHRIYVGRPITLKQAADAQMDSHGDCGPPSHRF